jgi:hypothetical protein
VVQEPEGSWINQCITATGLLLILELEQECKYNLTASIDLKVTVEVGSEIDREDYNILLSW